MDEREAMKSIDPCLAMTSLLQNGGGLKPLFLLDATPPSRRYPLESGGFPCPGSLVSKSVRLESAPT